MLRRRALSLVELLVVMGIVAIVAAIAIPSVLGARGSARSAQCQNNLRQIALGFTLYADAHGGRYPTGTTTPWFIEIAPHLEMDEGVFLCPDDPLGGGLSYDWRDERAVVPEVALGGKKVDRIAKGELVLVFDRSFSWHSPGTVNAATVGGAARPFEEEEFEENLLRKVETGKLFFLD